MSEVRLLVGDCVEVMRNGTAESIDAIVCDPPYGLGFMGKQWDDLPPGKEWAEECLRVLKPGGYLLAFGGTRTYHRLVCAIEDAGFEIRDCISWLYGSGFPKSMDVSKAIDKAAGAEREVIGVRETSGYPDGGTAVYAKRARSEGTQVSTGGAPVITAPATPDAIRWQGWGTALKPACEPIVVARKPLSEKTVAANVLRHGTGAINVDATRVEGAVGSDGRAAVGTGVGQGEVYGEFAGSPPRGNHPESARHNALGRWPANVVLSHTDECAQIGTREVRSNSPAMYVHQGAKSVLYGGMGNREKGDVRNAYGEDGKETVEAWACVEGCPVRALDSDSGGASRFFYCAKASKREREAGLEDFEPTFAPTMGDGIGGKEHNPETATKKKKNTHPTVKPVELMRWLVRMVAQPGGRVLDPFMGSGTTGIACVLEGFDFVGIDQDPDYAEISRARIAHAQSSDIVPTPEEEGE